MWTTGRLQQLLACLIKIDPARRHTEDVIDPTTMVLKMVESFAYLGLPQFWLKLLSVEGQLFLSSQASSSSYFLSLSQLSALSSL